VYMYVKGKMPSVEIIPGLRGDGDKGKWWRSAFKYDIFDIL
jgi:hypothetical protein